MLRRVLLLCCAYVFVACIGAHALSIEYVRTASDATRMVDGCARGVHGVIVFDHLDAEALRYLDLVRAQPVSGEDMSVYGVDVRNKATALLLPALNVQSVPALFTLRHTRDGALQASLVDAGVSDADDVQRLARLLRR